ncbi:hypothetical protein BGZ94_009454 [Podila epigama]|nr:hypothetical protein BGZ94_009454 [Podila epigama]
MSLSTARLERRAEPPLVLPKYTCTIVGECRACSTLQIESLDSCRETHNHQRADCKFDDPKNEENEELKSSNLLLALISGTLMVWRKRKLAAAQYRRMARRIGIA